MNCNRCNDTGEHKVTINSIHNTENNSDKITFNAFCSCKLGKIMAKVWNNGLGNDGGK